MDYMYEAYLTPVVFYSYIKIHLKTDSWLYNETQHHAFDGGKLSCRLE